MIDLGVATEIADGIKADLQSWRATFAGPYDGSDRVIESKRLGLWKNGYQNLDPAHIGPDHTCPPEHWVAFS
jgi:hypothetical protein